MHWQTAQSVVFRSLQDALLMTSVIELYPTPGMRRPLHHLYLDQDLRQTAGANGFVYTNFLSSLDGRIAMPGPDGRPRVPPAIANAKDWRLFQELAAQADVLLTSGRYLREYHPTHSQDVLLPYADPALRDLEQWRLARGLPAYPAVAALSNSLDFDIPEVLQAQRRPLLVFTGADHDPGRAIRLRQQGAEVHIARRARADGREVIQFLMERGHRFIYSATGPEVLDTLVASGCLHRLYLTFAIALLGGEEPTTLLRGQALTPVPQGRLHSLYLDQPPTGLGQQFACFDFATPRLPETAVHT